eukprot:12242757-Alexandrium_andersonii.AAC.1
MSVLGRDAGAVEANVRGDVRLSAADDVGGAGDRGQLAQLPGLLSKQPGRTAAADLAPRAIPATEYRAVTARAALAVDKGPGN